MSEIDVVCCADCGVAGGVSLRACTSCMVVKYCNAKCQRNHWPKHKKLCKQRAAEIRDEALFKDPPAKEDCPICFLPMPVKLIACMTLPPATISSVPIFDFAMTNEELASMATETYYSCCGKSTCTGCNHSLYKSGNFKNCSFCKTVVTQTVEEEVDRLMKRIEANDPGATYVLGNYYYHGNELQQDLERGKELYTQASRLGSSQAHFSLGGIYEEGGDLKKAKFHYGVAAMAGHEGARCNLGKMELASRNMERALKHYTIAASAGKFQAMNGLVMFFYEQGYVSRESIDSILAAYNNSCVEMRSEARDAMIRLHINRIGSR